MPRDTTVAEQQRPESSATLKDRAPKPAVTTMTGGPRYVVQVVTYSQPQLAKQELQRLQARGERAFLMLHDGRAIVNVGPFPSRDHASKKLSGLKRHYQDCFVRTL